MAFTIQHGPNLEALAALARSLGERQGHDSARQELEASQQQAFENDYNNRQLQQQADISRQNNRAAMDRVRTSGELDIERVQQQGRIDNYQINRQGAIQQQTNAQNNAAELAERSLLETMQSSPPQIQRQISGVLQQRSVVMSDPSLRPEQRQQLLMELDQNVQRIMDEAAVYQQPDPQQSFDSMRAVDPESGQAYFIGPDGKIEQAAQFHNTPRGLEARLQADIEQARIKTRAELIEGFLERRGQNADGTTRELGDADFAAARRYADNVMRQNGESPASAPPADTGPFLGGNDDGRTPGLRVDNTGKVARVRTATGEEATLPIGQLQDEDLLYWATQVVGVDPNTEPNEQQIAAMQAIVQQLRGQR